jgi:hypothetical protein
LIVILPQRGLLVPEIDVKKQLKLLRTRRRPSLCDLSGDSWSHGIPVYTPPKIVSTRMRIKGSYFAQVTTPPGAPQKYTQDVLDRMNEYFLTKERAAVDSVLTVAGFNPNLAAVRSNGLNGEPQYKIEIDREKANALSLTVSDVHTTLSAAWGHLSDCLSVLDLL